LRLDQYLDVERLQRYINDGYVMTNHHPYLPLTLYCYSRKAIWEDLWDDVTIRTRGLIVDDDTQEIVARPFEKFFNIDTAGRPETYSQNLPHDNFRPLMTEKIDGSLGIMWSYKGYYGIATKGSFVSEQAIWATTWIHEHLKTRPEFPSGTTPVFEIICEGIQHHVVHYGQDRLVLLGVIDNETGVELPYHRLCQTAYNNLIECVRAYTLSVADAVFQDRPNHEGYVASWIFQDAPPFRIKLKHQTFLKNQRLLHTATPKNILELLMQGKKDVLLQWSVYAAPSIRAYIDKWIKTLEDEYHHVFRTAHILLFEAMQKFTTRKEVALFLQEPENKPYAAVCFGILDNTTHTVDKYKHIIWKMVKRRVDLNDKTFEQPDDADDIDLLEAA
jgi:putative RNA ligase